MIDFAETLLGLAVVVFTYWLLEERAKRKREEETAARLAEACAVAQAELDRIRAQVAAARLAFERQVRFTVTIVHLGARHDLVLDGTETSRLAVLGLALQRTPLTERQ